MPSNTLSQRKPGPGPESTSNFEHGSKEEIPHPGGRIKHGLVVQLLRMALFSALFNGATVVIVSSQLLGSPLYFINKDYYYAYMALTKQSFGVVIAAATQWFSPTVVRVSGDGSVRGQLGRTGDGRLHTDFPERLVLIANHQIYTDWVYMWWAAYTSQMHGHLFIILKNSLKYIPFIGQGMMFYGFIFMARNWLSDKPRLQHRLEKLKSKHSGPMSGSEGLDPMWLLIYPEGTNLSANTRIGSRKWADKQGISDMRHLLLPRSTGMLFCLQQLRGTVDWVYDCTVAYEGTPKGGYAPDYFTLRSVYFQGRPPKSVNMYWRRFAVADIPLEDPKAFEQWLMNCWREKDDLLEYFYNTGRFPADDVHDSDGEPGGTAIMGAGHIETEVRLAHWYEVGQVAVQLAAFAMIANVLAKLWNLVVHGSFGGKL